MVAHMVKEIAFDLVQRYITGWKENDLTIILSCLTNDCVIIESHGPTYCGIADIECWFQFWLAANSTVTQWDIRSFNFCEPQTTAYVEWDFTCISNNVEHTLRGISVIRFSEKKIAFIHEYRMTHLAYPWTKDQLKSE